MISTAQTPNCLLTRFPQASHVSSLSPRILPRCKERGDSQVRIHSPSPSPIRCRPCKGNRHTVLVRHRSEHRPVLHRQGMAMPCTVGGDKGGLRRGHLIEEALEIHLAITSNGVRGVKAGAADRGAARRRGTRPGWHVMGRGAVSRAKTRPWRHWSAHPGGLAEGRLPGREEDTGQWVSGAKAWCRMRCQTAPRLGFGNRCFEGA